MYDKSTWNCKQLNLLFIAGVFDIWTNDNNEEILSFTMLSMASDDNALSWLHPRTPVILESAYQIYRWLNFNDYGGMQAMEFIQHPKSIAWYEVSDYVLNARNKDSECNKPLQDIKYQREKRGKEEEEGDDDDDDNED